MKHLAKGLPNFVVFFDPRREEGEHRRHRALRLLSLRLQPCLFLYPLTFLSTLRLPGRAVSTSPLVALLLAFSVPLILRMMRT